MFLLVSSLLSFLLFPIRGACAEGNSKNGSSEDTSKNIFRDRKKYKNCKTKNVLSVVIIFYVRIFCIFIFPTFVSNEVSQHDVARAVSNALRADSRLAVIRIDTQP